jgi:hypothetical protein
MADIRGRAVRRWFSPSGNSSPKADMFYTAGVERRSVFPVMNTIAHEVVTFPFPRQWIGMPVAHIKEGLTALMTWLSVTIDR